MFILLSFGLILFAIVCLLNIRLGSLLTILCLPLYLIRFNIFWIPINFLDILIFVLFLVWIGDRIKNYEFRITNEEREGRQENKQQSVIPAAVRRQRLCRRREAGIQSSGSINIPNSKFQILNSDFTIPISLLLAGCFLSTLLNDNKLRSLGIIKSWFSAPIIFFAILSSQFRSEKQRELILSVLAMSGVWVASFSLVYKYFGITTYDGRLQGMFNSPNYLAMYLSPIILIMLYKIIGEKSNIKNQISKTQSKNQKYESHSEAAKNLDVFRKYGILRWPLRMTLYFSFFVVLAAFFFTFSYSAWIALFVAGAVFFGLYIRKIGISKKLTFLFYGGFIAVLAIGLFSQLKSPKMADLVYSKRYSIESRQMIWRSAGLILKENPVFGIGLGSFQDEYLTLADSFEKPYLQWAVPHPHNIFLSFWLNCGLLGLIGFIWLLFIAIKKGLALMRTNPLQAILLISILIYILLHGLADTTYFKNDLAVVFWIIIALFF